MKVLVLGEAAGLRGIEGGGRAGLGGREEVEPPGDRDGESVPLTALTALTVTITQSSESLDGDVSLLDLQNKVFEYFAKNKHTQNLKLKFTLPVASISILSRISIWKRSWDDTEKEGISIILC